MAQKNGIGPENPDLIDDVADQERINLLSAIPDKVRKVTEDALARDFVSEDSTFRHNGQWSRWLFWTGNRWQIDYSMRPYNSARIFLRGVANDVSNRMFKLKAKDLPAAMRLEDRQAAETSIRYDTERSVKALLSARTIANVVMLSRSDPRVASDTDQWDRDPWVLNTPDGTVNLRTGALKPHDPKDYITKITAAGPKPGEPKLWLKFLHTIFRGDASMVVYLQKVFGYCLVGETKEHEMYFGYGTGANGKGVTLNTIRDLLGDYGLEASIETFIINPSQRHPTELADLRGARLVTCGETDEGQRWAEARIKMLTGGDPVKARFMRQDFFQFTPQFKLFLAGNHKPRLANVDEAIERRFRLIPFTYTVPREDRDVDLGHKLREEWPQILQWAIEGCMLWQREGLTPPEAVASATRSYLSQEDAITAWFGDCLESDEKGFVYIKDLFASWRDWAMDAGEAIGTKRVLTRHLEDREPILKIFKGNRSEGTGFRGVKIKPKPDSEAAVGVPTT